MVQSAFLLFFWIYIPKSNVHYVFSCNARLYPWKVWHYGNLRRMRKICLIINICAKSPSTPIQFDTLEHVKTLLWKAKRVKIAWILTRWIRVVYVSNARQLFTCRLHVYNVYSTRVKVCAFLTHLAFHTLPYWFFVSLTCENNDLFKQIIMSDGREPSRLVWTHSNKLYITLIYSAFR